MTTVLVVEDDDAIRNNIARLLKLEGYDVVPAIDGVAGLEKVRAVRPDVVISDISMPQMDCFALLEAIRADASIASTPVMLLTALDDRASMRRGMTAGADDYLAKPFTRIELLEALTGLLKKKVRLEQSIEQAVSEHETGLRQAFAESLAGRKPAGRFGLETPEGAIAEATLHATVLVADIRNFTSLAERLGAPEVSELLTGWFERITLQGLRHGGAHLKFLGDSLMALFPDAPGAPASSSGARRAIAAALDMALAAHEFRSWVEQRFPQRALPPFAIGVGLHTGPVTLCREASGNESTAVGETVHVAARVEAASKELGWTVAATVDVLQLAGEGVATRAMTSLEVRSGTFVDAAEITGIAADAAGETGEAQRSEELAAALQVNSEITARAVKGALQSRLATLKTHRFAPGEEPLRLRGYRLTRKIGSGGMTDVYLAERDEDGLNVVLKVLDASGKNAAEHLTRFIQEYALLSQVQHPHVVRIHDQGFTDDHAYIAMEYFPAGDLRAELSGGMATERVLAVLEQLAQALQAIHAHGIVHRDLKPENVMRRADGSVALADFGVAKPLQDPATLLARTRHGEEVGTPFYLSP